MRRGPMRALAVCTRKRLPAFPDDPKFIELGHADFEAVAWIGLVAPAGTPKEVRERLNTK